MYAKLFYLSLAHLITFFAEQKQMESDGNGEGMSRKVRVTSLEHLSVAEFSSELARL